MFNPFPAAMSITISGGNIEENQQLCSAVKASLQKTGFTSVHVEAGAEYRANGMTDQNLIACMRAINPDLFETPIVIQGESDGDMATQLAALGVTGVAVGAYPAVAFY